jgi:hypothetical protein
LPSLNPGGSRCELPSSRSENETSSRCKVKTDLWVLAEKSASLHPRGAGYVAAEESPAHRG